MSRHRQELPKLYGLKEVLSMFPWGARPSIEAIEIVALESGSCRLLSGNVYFTAEDVESLLEHIGKKKIVKGQGPSNK